MKSQLTVSCLLKVCKLTPIVVEFQLVVYQPFPHLDNFLAHETRYTSHVIQSFLLDEFNLYSYKALEKKLFLMILVNLTFCYTFTYSSDKLCGLC